MTIVKTYCDHCGKELDNTSDYISAEIKIGYVEINADLCFKCIGDSVEKTKAFCTQQGEEQNAES